MKKAKTAFLILMSIFFTTCCSTIEKKDEHVGAIEVSFVPYIYQFIKDSGGTVKEEDFYKLTMAFDDLDPGLAGYCWSNGKRQVIMIDTGWWLMHRNQAERFELIYHELGHCILDRRHTAPTASKDLGGRIERTLFKLGVFREIPMLSDGCPPSIMHPFTMSANCMVKHRNYYIDELFELNKVLRYEYKTTRVTIEEW